MEKSSKNYLDELKAGVLLLDKSLKVKYLNASAQSILDISLKASKNKSLEELFFEEPDLINEIGEKSFHMKDTKIPLDIAFINKDGIIESIKELEPLNTLPVYSDSEVLYALEVNRGWFAEKNIKVGDRVFDSIEEDTVRIDNSDGQEFASVIDIINPDPIKSTKSSIRWNELI